MSSDNGVYILRTLRTRKETQKGVWSKSEPYSVWRVAHVGAIDNFDWYLNNATYNLGAYMKDIWGNSPVFESEDEAITYANILAKDIEPLEYGVSVINVPYDMIFYGDY